MRRALGGVAVAVAVARPAAGAEAGGDPNALRGADDPATQGSLGRVSGYLSGHCGIGR